ncbi:hypothetical protein [Olivibacter sitiensis]|uniref:hypothetical protein n=1 Tax=Olivibacter sitiensis TaxID=376470 RepID=UPI0004115546|nr:hypothetical protein [Olivibacter sitiensis]
MNILLNGLNNYLGEKLAKFLAEENGFQELYCLIRNEKHFMDYGLSLLPNIHPAVCDLIREQYASSIPSQADAAIYLSQDSAEWNDSYRNMEMLSLQNFVRLARRTNCGHFIYITRLRTPFVEDAFQMLKESYINFTVVRMSNIIGPGSILMKMMDRLSKKPMILTDRRLANAKAQPIALNDLLNYVNMMILNPATFNQQFDIGGPDTLSYKDMLQTYLDITHIKRKIIQIPSIGNEIAALFVSMITGVSVPAARAYQENITGDLLCAENRIHELFPIDCIHFDEAIRLTLAETNT